ncbi:hypothetical protein VB713_24430 [Anabaena cylindrica UHCC 0172]|nr:hypothetical protein [Anabaena cylindrica]MEA5554089.1 hypothetical protein [Anabaena cylindrica UHCC 0172]
MPGRLLAAFLKPVFVSFLISLCGGAFSYFIEQLFSDRYFYGTLLTIH